MVRRGWFYGVIALLVVTLTACTGYSKKSERKVVEVPEKVEHERVVTEEEVKEKLLKQLSDEVRIYDVVEHQAVFREAIEAQMVGKNMDQLESTVQSIVVEHMDAYWDQRVRELLSQENEWYDESDVEWLLDRISTEDLYELIVLYEATYYKAYKGK